MAYPHGTTNEQIISELTAAYGAENVWTDQQAKKEFHLYRHSYPYASAVRKSDGTPGYIRYYHHPRLYFNFET